MKRVVILEHERLYKATHGGKTGYCEEDGRLYLSEKHFDRLHRFDERLSAKTSDQIFSWSIKSVKATKWVGIIQVAGLSVEILPKIESRQSNKDDSDAETRESFARSNMLYMLSVADKLPIKSRDVASQAVVRAPLIETLIRIFATRLRDEFLRGVHQHYVQREGNLGFLKGKLLFSQHVKRNAARRERFYVQYDEFLPDTRLNRIFKAACRQLIEVTRTPKSQEALGHCLMMLDKVADVPVGAHSFERVILTRQNDRFEEVFNFCRLILSGQSPAGSAGPTRSFTLLFDMEVLYESFMTEFIRRYVLPSDERFKGWSIHPQGRALKTYLLHYSEEKKEGGPLRLKPDILISKGEGKTKETIIFDTKWKRLSTKKSSRQNVGRDDLYQMFGYAHAFEARQNILLYPEPPEKDIESLDYEVPGGVGEPRKSAFVGVRTINLSRDIKKDRVGLVSELSALLLRIFNESSPPPT